LVVLLKDHTQILAVRSLVEIYTVHASAGGYFFYPEQAMEKADDGCGKDRKQGNDLS